MIEKFDLPIGELTMIIAFAFMVPGPFTGIEYWTPDSSYHCAFVIASCTIPPETLPLIDVNDVMLV